MVAATATSPAFRKTRLGRWNRKVATKLWLLRKWLHWRLHPAPSGGQRVVFIVGCQRSGTTLVGDLFERDLRSTVFYEDSEITGKRELRLRLRPLDEVKRVFGRCRTPLVVAKPIVESQHTRSLLEQTERAKAIWVYRDYRDVVNSNLQRFHRQRENLVPLVEGQLTNWRSEKSSGQTRAIVKRFYSPSMSRADAAALQWYSRNVLFFELDLASRSDILMCKYEDLVSDPQRVWRGVYEFLGLSPPPTSVLAAVDARSVGGGAKVKLAPEIDELCRSLLQRLDAVFWQRNARDRALVNQP